MNHWIKCEDGDWINLDQAIQVYIRVGTYGESSYQLRAEFGRQSGSFLMGLYNSKEMAEGMMDQVMAKLSIGMR